MAVYYRTLGFVLTKEDVREADQVFTVFTKDFGKIKILGRAIRKIKSKLRSGIDLFYLSEIEFIQGKNYKTLTDASAIEKHKDIRNNLETVDIFQKITKTADILIKGEEKDEKIWNLFVEIFDKLNNYQLSVHYFSWTLISLLGYQIDLYHCVKCQERLVEEIINFSPEHRGIVCLRCSDDSIKGKIKIFPETVKILRIIQKEEKTVLQRLKIEKNHLEELDKILESYLISF